MLLKLKKQLHSLFLNWKKMLLFQILYSLLYTVIFYSLFNFLLSIALRLDGYSYLNSANMIPFLLTPPGILLAAVLLIIAAFFTYFNAGILLAGFQASTAGQRIGLRQLVLHGLHECISGFHPKRLYYALPLFAYNLVSSVFILYQLIFRVNPFSTFLPQLFSKASYCIILAAVFLLLAAFALRQFFSICYWYLGECSLSESIKKSPELSRKHIPVILRDTLIINAAIILLWVCLRFILQVITVLAVNLLAPEDLKVAMVLSINSYLSMALLWFSCLIGFFLNLSLMVRLYYRFTRQDVILEIKLYEPTLTPRHRKYAITAMMLMVTLFIVFLYHGIYNGALLSERTLTPVQIISHRGLSSEAPENTIPAIELAIDSLADVIEIDVQLTKDGVVIVSHDTNLRRTAGRYADISSLTYEELLQYDVGSYFSEEFAGTTIPTLEEVMTLVKGRANLLIELKRNSAGANLAEKVVALIEQYDMEYQCDIQSSDYTYLKQVNELNPDIRLGYILTAAIGNYYQDDMVDFFGVRSMFVNELTVARAHEEGKAIYAWTVNTRAEIERMKTAQVDGIVTDYPAKAREVIYREAGSETILNLLRLVL